MKKIKEDRRKRESLQFLRSYLKYQLACKIDLTFGFIMVFSPKLSVIIKLINNDLFVIVICDTSTFVLRSISFHQDATKLPV